MADDAPILLLIPADKIDAEWHLVAELIDAACKRDGVYTAGDVKTWLRDRRMFLFLAWSKSRGVEGLAVAEPLQHALLRSLNVFIVTGHELARWAHLVEQIEAWAKRVHGCTRSIFTCREGYLRALKGYRKTHIVMEKDL